eukprot:1129889_1
MAEAIVDHELEYVHVLNTMNSCGQPDIIGRFIEEATDYQTKTALELEQIDDMNRAMLLTIENKIIELLEGILNDGAVPFDVAFCRLLIILPYVHTSPFAFGFIGFFFYFVLGSCFPSVRKHITFNDAEPHDLRSRILRYLMVTYFPNLNDARCIKFKYCVQRSTTLFLLEQCITTATEYGDLSVARVICDYAQFPNQEFVSFLNNFLWHFPLHQHLQRCTAECIKFVDHFEHANDTTRGHLLSRLLIGKYFLNHKDERLKYEAHRMALMKLETGEGIGWYFNQKMNRSIRCCVHPKLFIALFECAVPNPWHVMRDAIMNHSLSIFYNGNDEESVVAVSVALGKRWCKQMIRCLHYIFKNVIACFDRNDMELADRLSTQFARFYTYCSELSLECEAKNELLAVFWKYWSHDFFQPSIEETWQLYQNAKRMLNASKAPPSKKRRINGQQNH